MSLGKYKVSINEDNIDLQAPSRLFVNQLRWQNEATLLLPARTSFVDFIDPGNPDTSSWIGAAIGKPFIYDNFATDGFYYLFFDTYKYYTATGDWAQDSWRSTIGVARATSIGGTYTYLNGSDSILEPSSNNALWHFGNLTGSSIYTNPNFGDDELFAFQDGPFTVEMLLHLTDYPTGAGENVLIEHRDSDGNVVWGLYLHHAGAGSRHIRAKVTVDSVTSITGTLDTFTQPEKDQNIILGLSYHPTIGFLTVYLSQAQTGANKTKTLFIPAPGFPDSSTGGTTTILNDQDGNAFNSFVHLVGIRLLSDYSFSSDFSGRASTVIGAGAFASTSDTIFFANFADADDRYHRDGNLGDAGGELIDVSWVADTGLLANSANERIELHNPPVSQFVMLLSSLDLGGVLGLAFSNSLNQNWVLYPLPSLDLQAANGAIADPYITGKNKKLNGILFPRLYTKSSQVSLLYGEELTDTYWSIRQRELDSLFYPQSSVATIKEGTYPLGLAISTDFDYLGTSAPFPIADDFIALEGPFEETLFYEGDSVITADRALSGGGTEEATVHLYNIGVTGVDV